MLDRLTVDRHREAVAVLPSTRLLEPASGNTSCSELSSRIRLSGRVVVGALNWGLVGLFQFDLVALPRVAAIDRERPRQTITPPTAPQDAVSRPPVPSGNGSTKVRC